MSNISLDKPYKWLKDEEFYSEGVLIVRKQGELVGGTIMKEVLQIREESPELLADVSVYQQPRAVRDEIILKWSQEELRTLLGAVPILQQVDLVGTQWTKKTRENAFTLNIVRTPIAGGMTPHLQLTDIMSAKMSHEASDECVRGLRGILRRKAIEERVKPIFKYGKRETITCAAYIRKKLVKKQNETNWIVNGMRQAGHFCYRPSLSKKALVDCDEQDWAKEYPLGAGGKISESWIVNRKQWLDENGRAPAPDWERQVLAVDAMEERERTYCAEYEKEHDVLVIADEQDLMEENEVLLQQHPKLKEKVYREKLKKVTKQGVGAGLLAGLTKEDLEIKAGSVEGK